MSSFRVTSRILKADELDVLHLDSKLLFLNKDAHLALYDVDTLDVYDFTFTYGTVWDGLSTPALLNWFLPSYDKDNNLYNWSGLVHDGLYGSELLPKDIADDVFRSVLRDSGISRFKASSAEFWMSKFSGSHYGVKNDKHGIRYHIRMEITRR